MRAVRVDKMTLAALEATLRIALGGQRGDPALDADGDSGCRSSGPGLPAR